MRVIFLPHPRRLRTLSSLRRNLDPRRGSCLYGGTNDGYLFRLDLGSLEVTNLGKPRITRRIRALAVAGDGRVYGVAGEDKAICTLFSYGPHGGGYTHYGPLDVDETPYYAWRPQRFGAMATGSRWHPLPG